ncbi:MAG: methylmalonyl-CoA mutase family protein [Nocardioides sp.]
MNVSARTGWERAAGTALRRAGLLGTDDPDSEVWARLSKATLDGVQVPVLGTPADGEDDDDVRESRRNLSRLRGWDVRVRSCGGESALGELVTGATSLWLDVPVGASAAELGALLPGVQADLVPIVVECRPDPVGAARALAAWIDKLGIVPATGTGLGADPLGRALLADGDRTDPSRVVVGAEVAQIAQLANSVGLTGFVIDATAVHDLGASDAQELGYSVAAGVTYLRLLADAGVAVDDAVDLLEFRYAATDEQFLTIAKFRAARQLWSRIREVCGVSPSAKPQRQHAVTSRPMMTRYDPWVNMLRTTVAAFAAGVGGADAVTVLPFDSALGEPNELGRRIARNTSSLLIAEAQVGKVADPAGGSYAVEQLTSDLARAAWAEFGRIESAGGLFAGFRDASARMGDAAARRAAQVARRARPITGVSEFPDPQEQLLQRGPHADGGWPVASYAGEFEALRDVPEGPVCLLALGSTSEHTARVTLMTNLFGAGGITVDASDPLADPNAALAAYAGQPAVCVVGNDRRYADWGAALVAGVRERGARWVMIAGPPGGLNVDDSFAVGDDALAFLRRTRAGLR